ncbi:hypothetical protein EV421DRAFT_1741307 [Armillaria borealis]|uniref:Uncharacterized protein n=1 Tax=Armillaria borealis TaxID=47425 RepID=A0AA39J1X4_9AGAR|nr:hypothetical protein EV421DRAFT_1741307 [Armillaria borealis]
MKAGGTAGMSDREFEDESRVQEVGKLTGDSLDGGAHIRCGRFAYDVEQEKDAKMYSRASPFSTRMPNSAYFPGKQHQWGNCGRSAMGNSLMMAWRRPSRRCPVFKLADSAFPIPSAISFTGTPATLASTKSSPYSGLSPSQPLAISLSSLDLVNAWRPAGSSLGFTAKEKGRIMNPSTFPCGTSVASNHCRGIGFGLQVPASRPLPNIARFRFPNLQYHALLSFRSMFSCT